MPEVNKSVLVGYPASRMFAIVDAVEKYPEFLPWCESTELIFRDARVMRATICINYRGIKQRFSTENAKNEPRLMQIRLIEGPFKTLDGYWRFTDLGGSGCKIEFNLQYEIASRLLDKMIGPVFGYIANSLVDAFVKRAQNLYG